MSEGTRTTIDPPSFTRSWLSDACHGSWTDSPPPAVRGIGTDTREDLAGRLFVALRGPNSDGHDHLAAAKASGAVAAIVAEDSVAATAEDAILPRLVVADTMQALADLATAHRTALHGPVIAVTGSQGKTTTKGMLSTMLAPLGPGVAARRSFNNAIGVPLTILSAPTDAAFTVCEVGTSSPGEIESLARIIRPDVAIITTIGRAHIGAFGSINAIAREKAELLRTVGDLPARAPGAEPAVILPDDAPALQPFVTNVPQGVTQLRVGRGPGADLQLLTREISHTGDGDFTQALGFRIAPRTGEASSGSSLSVRIPVPGMHNARNAANAIAAAVWLGVPHDAIRRQAGQLRVPSMRLARTEVSGVTVHNDAWNANPEAVAAALESFGELTAGLPANTGRIVVLGDMLELGPDASPLHEAAGRSIARLHDAVPLKTVILLGEHAADVARGIGDTRMRVLCFRGNDHADQGTGDEPIRDAIQSAVSTGDHVLLKGSRGMKLERVLDWLDARPTRR